MLIKCYYTVLYLFWVILPWPVVTAFTVIGAKGLPIGDTGFPDRG